MLSTERGTNAPNTTTSHAADQIVTMLHSQPQPAQRFWSPQDNNLSASRTRLDVSKVGKLHS